MITKITVLTLMAAFYVFYFGKMLRQKKRGIRTDQLGKGKEGIIRLIEIALKTVTCLLPLGQVASIVFFSGEAPVWARAAGIALTALGVLFFALSVIHMKDNWRAGIQKDEKTDLVTDGIYSVSRNPAFVGFDLMYIGVLTAFFNVYLCAATAVALVLFHLQIARVEEPFLVGAFGAQYESYRRKVCRYLGRKPG